jgi:transketolase
MKNKERILEISKKHHLAHIGSCLSVLPILEEIYQKKKPQDKVVMDNAHAHLAHLVIMEEDTRGDSTGLIRGIDAEEMLKAYGIHCDRQAGCAASGGSLGHGIGISIGMALTKRERNIFCIVSDGSMQEGSNWEALRIKEQLHLDNLHIYTNFNGYTAVAKIDPYRLAARMRAFTPITVRFTDNGLPELQGLKGHYINL